MPQNKGGMNMVVTEHALEGTKEIAEYLGLSPGTVQNNYVPKMKKAGIIFTRLRGTPPLRRKQIYTFPSLVQQYLMAEIEKKHNPNDV